MREHLLLVALLITIILGCGAQNNPQEEEEAFQDSPRVTDNSLIELPQTITIAYPKIVKERTETQLYNDIIEIEKITHLLEDERRELEDQMEYITKECELANPCSLNLNQLTFQQYNNTTTPYHYRLTLEKNSTTTITFQWRTDRDEVKSSYQEKNATLTLHYAKDTQREALYIKHQKKEEHTMMVILQKELTYQLDTIHIKTKEKNTMEHIRIEENTPIATTEDSIKITSLEQNLTENDYLLVSSSHNNRSNFIDNIEFAEGIVSVFHQEFQGFLYNQGLDETEEIKAIPLK